MNHLSPTPIGMLTIGTMHLVRKKNFRNQTNSIKILFLCRTVLGGEELGK